jgi:hypothetical protein
MEITNNYKLPEPLVNAVKNQPYDPGESYITATGLISPPLIRKLKALHDHEITEDAMDRIWALMGSIGHRILEFSTERGLAEERLFADIAGKKVSAQIDNLSLTVYDDLHDLTDYKFTSAWAVVFGKDEWEQQLNIQDYLLWVNGYDVDRLFICAILRDWDKNKVKAGYPPAQVHTIQIAKWEREKQEEYIARRLAMHLAAEEGIVSVCSDSERWKKEPVFKVMKEGRKTALRVLPTMGGAIDWMKEKDPKGKQGLFIKKFDGSYTRCEGYCSVQQFCPEYQNGN